MYSNQNSGQVTFVQKGEKNNEVILDKKIIFLNKLYTSASIG